MCGLLQYPVRVVGRLLWLSAEVVLATFTFVIQVPFRSNLSSLEARSRWLQASCRRALRIFNVDIRTTGAVPNGGLLVSNHLSYLDILVLSALTPSVFVAKREVRSWPVFGWFARLAGTLFADREKRLQVGQLTKSLRTVLEQGVQVVLFPEGTSSDGQTVLPFKSSLLEPATDCAHRLTAGLIQYRLEDGDVGEEVCYWKDMTFLPHLINLLSKRRVEVSVAFTELGQGRTGRKELARQLRAEVLKLKGIQYSPALETVLTPGLRGT